MNKIYYVTPIKAILLLVIVALVTWFSTEWLRRLPCAENFNDFGFKVQKHVNDITKTADSTEPGQRHIDAINKLIKDGLGIYIPLMSGDFLYVPSNCIAIKNPNGTIILYKENLIDRIKHAIK